MRVIVWWIRQDRRVHDNALLHAVTQLGKHCRLLPVFVQDPFFYNDQRCSSRRRQWEQLGLIELDKELKYRGSVLHFVRAGTVEALRNVINTVNGEAEVWCSAESTSQEQDLEKEVEKVCGLRRFETTCLFEWPDDEMQQLPFSYSRFRFKVAPRLKVPEVLEAPQRLPPLPDGFQVEPVPSPDAFEHDKRSAIRGLQAGERHGLARMEDYLTRFGAKYHSTRNEQVGVNYSTKWSLYLADGSLSVRRVYMRVMQLPDGKAKEALKLELLWREYFLALARKTGPAFFWWKSFRGQEAPPLKPDEKRLEAWKSGRTGVAYVDAFMRELAETGFMSNRGRQVVASYLIWDLQQDWREGAAHFERLLLDHSPAPNSGNWKYLAMTGTDVRVTKKDVKKQRKMYDPKGEFCKLWS